MPSVIVLGRPPRKNTRHELVSRGRYTGRKNSDAYLDFVDRLRMAWGGRPRITSGLWKVTIESYWPGRRKLERDVGAADVDAPIPSVLDALQASGALDDDVRIVELFARKHYAPRAPRTVIHLERLDVGCAA